MDAERQSVPSPRTTLYRWGAFLLVVIVASTLFGPLVLMVLSIVAGGAAIWTGIRSAGWPRPVLIILGALLVLAPVLLFVDVAFGQVVAVVQ
jgi:hypothetical protein